MKKEEALRQLTPLSRDPRARFAAYVGVLAAYLAAVRDDPLTPFQVGFFLSASLWSLGFESRLPRLFFSSPLKVGLIVVGSCVFLLFFLEGAPGGGMESFAGAIARFLFWNSIVFVLSRNKSDYDVWTLAIVALSLFMLSSSFVRPPQFLPLLLLGAACFVYAFQRMALLKCGRAGLSEKRGLGLAAATVLFVFAEAAFLFIVFPRQAFVGSKPSGKPGQTPEMPALPQIGKGLGGGETVGPPPSPDLLDLVHFNKLKEDRAEVLLISIKDAQGRPVPIDQIRHLRGALLDRYADGRWSPGAGDFDRQLRRDADDGKTDGWTRLDPSLPGDRFMARQHVQTTALSKDMAFCLAEPARVRWQEARYDPAGVLFFPTIPKGNVEYEVESALYPLYRPRSLEVKGAPERYLQLPPGLDRLRALAREHAGESAPAVYDKVSALSQFLKKNCLYKSDPFVAPEGIDPAEYFLFEKKEGCCTHFATALALLCRAAGIPARLAVGFQIREKRDDGSWRVRNCDAHSWVEVWFGTEHGWRTVDPTPPSSDERDVAPPPKDPVAKTEPKTPEKESALEPEPPQRWDHFFVDLEPESQNDILGRIAVSTLRGVANLAHLAVSPPVLILLGALTSAALILWLFLPRRQKNRMKQIMAGFRERTAIDFYRDFLWAMAQRGLIKPRGMTPREFARQVRLKVDDDGIDFLTEKFYEARWRGVPPAPEDRRRIDGILARLLLIK